MNHPGEHHAETERFVELATRGLEGAPREREEAKAELTARLAHGDADALPPALARLEAAKKPRPWWAGPCLTLAAVVLCGGLAAWQGRQALTDMAAGWGLMGLGAGFQAGVKDPLRESLDEESRDFVYAVVGNDGEVVAKLEREWQRHPGELGIYEELALRRLAASKGLPEDFSSTWRQLDPENGVWLYLEAIGKNEEWKKTGPAAGEAYSREVVDLLRQSAAAPRYESHIPALRKKRLAMIPPTGRVAEEIHLLLYSISALWEPSIRWQRETVLTLDKAARECAEKGDTAGLTELIRSWKSLVARLNDGQMTLLGLIVPASSWNETSKAMLKASQDLGMAEEEKELDELVRNFTAYGTAYRSGSFDGRPLSSLARILFVGNSVRIDPADFAPGRNAEYAQADRLLGWAAAILVSLFLLGAGIESFRRGRSVNGLALGLGPLFRPVDFLWIAGLGVVVPVGWYLGFTHLTPLGLRDIGASHYKPHPLLIQAGAALVFSLLAIVQTAKWRVRARTRMLGPGAGMPWVGWCMTGLAAAVIPATGYVRWLTANEERFLQGMAATGGLALLWLVWEAAAVVFSPRDSSLRGVLLCRRMLAPLAILAAVLLGGWVPQLSTERHWHSQDQMSRVDRSTGGLSRQEGRMVERLRDIIAKSFPQ